MPKVANGQRRPRQRDRQQTESLTRRQCRQVAWREHNAKLGYVHYGGRGRDSAKS